VGVGVEDDEDSDVVELGLGVVLDPALELAGRLSFL
jgi:hypothetical protein